MPVTVFDNMPFEKQEVIQTLSKEIDSLYPKLKKMNDINDVINSGIDLLHKNNQVFKDDSLNLRYITHFIAIQTFENNNTIIEMLSSKSEINDIPLMKKGIGDMKEGCKLLIGFYIKNEKGQVKDKLIKNSLLYQVHSKVQNDHPDIYRKIEAMINDFRDKLEQNNIKDIRDELIHYQKKDGRFNPFNFTTTALKLNCNDVYNLLFDYCLFLRRVKTYVYFLSNLGYR